MRRRDREMSAGFAREILAKCAWATVAMITPEGEPYCVPLSIAGEGDVVYFHAAVEGKKTDCLRHDPRVWIVGVGSMALRPEMFSADFESFMACGLAEEVTDDAGKMRALRLICERHAAENLANHEEYARKSLSRTAIWKIVLSDITGKRHKYAPGPERRELPLENDV